MDERWYDWDPSEDIESLEDIAAYLNAIIDEDPALLPRALGDIARSKGMSEVSARSGLGRESLYKALSEGAQPRIGTIQKVLSALGLKLKVERAEAS